MKVKQLIKKLNELVEDNPNNANIEVRWYDDSTGKIANGDGWPIQLVQNIYNKEVRCILNAVHNPVAFGMKPVSKSIEKETTVLC